MVNGLTDLANTLLTASGTTLGGSGTIGGAVYLASGATLSLGGASPTTLSLTTNSCQFVSGCIVNMRIRASDGACDLVTNIGTVYYGGTLNVANLGGALAAGQSFQLFAATNFSSTFTTLNLPALGGGLAWSFNPTNGVLSVNTSSIVSSNAFLTSLVISPAGTLNPAFTTNNFSYTATNPYVNNPVTVTATAADPGATLQLNFNGGGYGPLTNGVASSAKTLVLPNNTIAVRVTAADSSTVQTYNVNVTLQPSLTPAKLTNSVNGSTLTLSWPADHLGWHLQMQTNTLAAGLKTNGWVVVPGSDQITSTNISITKTNPTVFYRITYP
jgi:hypothetical protein